MKNYFYFVSFYHEKGAGNIEIKMNYRIKEVVDIVGIADVIKKETGCKNPIVINYKFLRLEVTPDE